MQTGPRHVVISKRKASHAHTILLHEWIALLNRYRIVRSPRFCVSVGLAISISCFARSVRTPIRPYHSGTVRRGYTKPVRNCVYSTPTIHVHAIAVLTVLDRDYVTVLGRRRCIGGGCCSCCVRQRVCCMRYGRVLRPPEA